MRLVDDLFVDVKRSWRRAAYSSPIWKSALPESIIVDLPVDDSSLGEAEILERLGAIVRWIGPVAVTITGSVSENPASAELAVALVRFARRSGAHVRFVVEGEVSIELSRRLVRVGLAEAVVCIGSLEEKVHSQVVGSDLGHALDAVSNLREARVGSDMSLVVAAIVSPGIDSSLRALIGWARQSHVDSVVLAPKRGTGGDTIIDLADTSIDIVAPSLQRKNSGGNSTPVRLAIKLSADGGLWISRDTPLGSSGKEDLSFLWQQSLIERKAVRGLEIPFDEIDLDLWGR